MSKNLTVQQLYERDATQNADITVYGETTTGITADAEIVMHVPKLALSDILTYNSGWSPYPPTAPEATAAGSSEQPQPDLKLDFAPIEAYLDALHAKLADGNTAGTRTFKDDGNTDISTIGKLFASQTFTWTSSILDSSIPAAAVRKVSESHLSVLDLFDGLQAGPREASPSAGVSAESNTLRSLFEQAVAAGVVTKENSRASAADPVNRKCLELSSGDSIDIYIKYNMTKTRRQEIDADVTSNNTGGFTNARDITLKLTFGGVEFDVTLGGNEDEASNVSTYTYKVKLIAKEVEAAGDANEGKITVAEGGSVFVPRV